MRSSFKGFDLSGHFVRAQEGFGGTRARASFSWTLRTFRSNNATATRTSLRKWIWLLSALKQLFLHSYFVKCRQTLLKVFSFFFNPGSERDVKFPRRLFTIAIKRKISHFHVVVVWKRQRNVQKSVTHVQTFFFAYWSYNCFLFVALVAVSLLDLKIPDREIKLRRRSWKRRKKGICVLSNFITSILNRSVVIKGWFTTQVRKGQRIGTKCNKTAFLYTKLV